MTSRPMVLATRPNPWPAAALLLLIPMWGAAQSTDEPDFNPAHIVRTYHVHHSTPLSAVFLEMQQSFLYPINYEEVPYESPRELVSRDIVGLNGKHINYLGIPEIDFSVTLTNLETRPLLAVQKTIAEHKNAGLPGAGQYEILERDHRIDVLPYQVLGADGSEHRVKPVMSYLISFPKASRFVTATLELISDRMSQASGKKVALANQPFYVMDHMVELGASAESAGDVIEALATQLNTTLSYQVTYEATFATYYLSIYPVSDPKIYGNLKNNRAPGATPPPATNPFFKKDQQR